MNGRPKAYFNLCCEELPSTGSDSYIPSEGTSIFTRDCVKRFMRKGDWEKTPIAPSEKRAFCFP